jgi:hypothetical protein
VLILVIPSYWMIGLQPFADRYFIYVAVILVHALTANALGLAIGSAGLPYSSYRLSSKRRCRKHHRAVDNRPFPLIRRTAHQSYACFALTFSGYSYSGSRLDPVSVPNRLQQQGTRPKRI